MLMHVCPFSTMTQIHKTELGEPQASFINLTKSARMHISVFVSTHSLSFFLHLAQVFLLQRTKPTCD